ncbi:DNA-binding protein Ikaros-like isoform X1 [Osmerus eperlanus]|uniref:DNA-binding protein Ikaros-like isoform X1 n=2 Tax=Osmerus eperlanus TaxID=29151 RepID=UPI002E133A25
MNRDQPQEFKPAESEMMDISSSTTDQIPQEESEVEKKKEAEEMSYGALENASVNEMESSSESADKEQITAGIIVKTEEEETFEQKGDGGGGDELKDERGGFDALEEEEEDDEEEEEEEEEREREGEEGEEEEEDEERDGDEEGDPLDEPQDLSLADYGKYDNQAEPTDARHPGTAAPLYGAPAAGASPRGHTGSKLCCDICGLSCVSINVLLVHKRSHTGERPFHCTQCGASFTQKGNLLRHIKLHSGEKPFKCPMCSYACRRRDALSGHLRTHSVEKPYKCNHCGRSYKQRSSLEEHRERCHVYIQNKGHTERASEDAHASRTQMGSERALLLDRLASNVAKRKSSMPQKFTGDNGVCLDLSFNRELLHHRTDAMDPPPHSSPGPDALHHHSSLHAGQDSGDPAHRSYPVPLALTNGHKLELPPPGLSHLTRPGQGHLGLDPLHPDSLSQPLYSLGHLLGVANAHNGLPLPHGLSMAPPEALRVVRGDGEAMAGAVYPCAHCRVIFLDYVMFTIHMGCHGFRDPLECNVCGHRSRDRYEFSSHIARGEHRIELK